ncbi:hypothetical protein C2S52_008102 [Perilla frutescens var. hirtella]|nr:hypothetical protein C2S52_008102 [Perilla frutescens var. hirtella]
METNVPNNPTMNQLKVYEEKVSRRFRALSTLHAAGDETIFKSIMDCGSAKQVWDMLQTEFQGNEKTEKMQVFNLRKEFELLKMKEIENIKEYIDKVMKVVYQIRLPGEELPEKRIVEKVTVALPEIFESKISSLEDTCDMMRLTLTKLVSALQAVEQRKACREEEKSVEKALQLRKPTYHLIKNFQARKGKERKDQQGFKGSSGKKNIHRVLIARRQIMLKTIVGSDLVCSVGVASNLGILRRYVQRVKIKKFKHNQLKSM